MLPQGDHHDIPMLLRTNSVFKVAMSNKFEVFLYGFGCQCVLPEDQMFSVHEAIYLTQRHVRQKILLKKNN